MPQLLGGGEQSVPLLLGQAVLNFGHLAVGLTRFADTVEQCGPGCSAGYGNEKQADAERDAGTAAPANIQRQAPKSAKAKSTR